MTRPKTPNWPRAPLAALALSLLTSSTCFQDELVVWPGVCGDGHVDEGEECDDGNQTDGDGCDSTCHLERPACGNGLVEAGEECDGTDLGGKTCESLGFAGGTLTCLTECRLDTSGCQRPSEVCDNSADDDGDGLADCADPDCADDPACQPVCGNGVVEPGEACDDGNRDNSDECPDGPGGTCQLATCGDGFLWRGREECDTYDLGGETCESLGYSGGTLGCTSSCTFDTSQCQP